MSENEQAGMVSDVALSKIGNFLVAGGCLSVNKLKMKNVSFVEKFQKISKLWMVLNVEIERRSFTGVCTRQREKQKLKQKTKKK